MRQYVRLHNKPEETVVCPSAIYNIYKNLLSGLMEHNIGQCLLSHRVPIPNQTTLYRNPKKGT